MFYSIDPLKATHGEYWRNVRSPSVIFAFIAKWIRYRLPSSTDDPPVESLAPFEVPILPPEPQSRLDPIVRELQLLGFGGSVYHYIDDGAHSTQTSLISLRHASLPVIARVHFRNWSAKKPSANKPFVEYITPLADGTFLWSLSARPDLDAPPSMRIIRRPGMALSRLWEFHQQALACAQPQSIPDDDQMRQVLERHHAQVRDFHLARGVFTPLSDDDRRQIECLRQRRSEAATGAIEYPEIIAELDRLGRKRPGWGNSIVILILSVALFIGAGRSIFQWTELLLLIPILLFHELGHFVAMKLFGYRDVRMFFIPFFGAAVAGRNYSAPGWKKVVVALAGPVPGLIVGVVLGIMAHRLHNELLFTACLLTLVLNGLNLLPVFPLDGGRVVHVLLFSRHYLLDVAFRSLAALILVGVGLSRFGDKPLLFLGAFMLVGIPAAYRLARVTADIRKMPHQPIAPPPLELAGLPPVPDAPIAANSASPTGIVPLYFAQMVIARLKQAFPKGLSNRMIAQHTLNVYESVNARPPGALGTLGLLAIHGGSFAATVAFLIVLMVLHSPERFGQQRFAYKPPAHQLDVASIRRGGNPVPPSPDSAVTIIGTFPGPSHAARVFARLEQEGQASLLCFGDTILATIDAENTLQRDHLTATMRQSSGAAVGHAIGRAATRPSANPMMPLAIFRLQCAAPDNEAASRISEQLEWYFGSPSSFKLIPPWQEDDARSPELRSRHDLARKTYYRLRHARSAGVKDPAMVALRSQYIQAIENKDIQASAKLSQQMRDLSEQLYHQECQSIAAEPQGQVDRQLIADFLRIEEGIDSRRSYVGGQLHAYDSLASRMGQLATGRLGATGAALRQEGNLVRLESVFFTSAPDGAAALVRWLAGEGCSRFQYDFETFNDDDGQ